MAKPKSKGFTKLKALGNVLFLALWYLMGIAWKNEVILKLVIAYLFDIISQNELVATNALVCCSIHWMGCIYSFGTRWGSSQFLFYFCWPLYLVFFVFVLGYFFPGPDFTHSYPTHLPTFINIVPTLVLY